MPKSIYTNSGSRNVLTWQNVKEGADETDLGWIPQFNIFDRLGSVVFEYNVIENSQGL